MRVAHLSAALALFDADPDGPGKDLFASRAFKATMDPDAGVRAAAGAAMHVLFRRFRPEKHLEIYRTVLARLPPVVEDPGFDVGSGEGIGGETGSRRMTPSHEAYVELSAKFAENESRWGMSVVRWMARPCLREDIISGGSRGGLGVTVPMGLGCSGLERQSSTTATFVRFSREADVVRAADGGSYLCVARWLSSACFPPPPLPLLCPFA